MIIFWILSAGLIVLALAFVALPLLRAAVHADSPAQDELNLEVFKQRLKELDGDLASGFLDQAQYASARRDLERDLLHDVPGGTIATPVGSSGGRWLAPVLALAVPAAAIALYLQVGDHRIITQMEQAARGGAAAPADHAGQELPPMEVLVQRLEERMAENPGNIEGWVMLGRTYFMMRRPEDALAAITKAYELAPENPDVMLAYAEALAATSDNSLEGKPAELIEQVIARDPQNTSALWLLGMLYYQRGQYASASTAWERVLATMAPDAEEVEDLRAMIAEAKARAGEPPASAASEPAVTASAEPAVTASATSAAPPAEAAPVVEATTEAAPQPTRAVSVQVQLDPAVAASATPDDIVFVFARAAGGPPMPLAVQRLQVKELPASVTLDDSMGMTPGMNLAAFPEIVVVARISKSGQATPQPGDLEGESAPLDTTQTQQVSISIDRVRP